MQNNCFNALLRQTILHRITVIKSYLELESDRDRLTNLQKKLSLNRFMRRRRRRRRFKGQFICKIQGFQESFQIIV